MEMEKSTTNAVATKKATVEKPSEMGVKATVAVIKKATEMGVRGALIGERSADYYYEKTLFGLNLFRRP